MAKKPKLAVVEESPEAKRWEKPPVQEILESINMRYGSTGPIARVAKESWDASDLRRPCGILRLDIDTGGGLCAGKVHQVSGPEGVGKNFLLYQYFAHVQETYGDKSCLAMACFESFVDKQFAQMCGCKIAMSPYDIEVSQRARKLYGQPPLTDQEIEDALNCPGVGEFVIFQGRAENVLDGIVEAVRSNQFQLIGIDSWDVMQTTAEEEKTLEETPQVASPSTIQTRWSKKILDAFNPVFRCPECGYAPLARNVIRMESLNYKYVCKHCEWSGKKPDVEINETTVYCIRQVRDKISMGGQRQMGRPYDSKGARALKHLNHMHIMLHPGSYITDKAKIKIGKEITWEIKKAKGGAREGATGVYELQFSPIGVDLTEDLLNAALACGAAVFSGKSYSFVNCSIDKIAGRDSVLAQLDENEIFRQELMHQTLLANNLGHIRYK